MKIFLNLRDITDMLPHVTGIVSSSLPGWGRLSRKEPAPSKIPIVWKSYCCIICLFLDWKCFNSDFAAFRDGLWHVSCQSVCNGQDICDVVGLGGDIDCINIDCRRSYHSLEIFTRSKISWKGLSIDVEYSRQNSFIPPPPKTPWRNV